MKKARVKQQMTGQSTLGAMNNSLGAKRKEEK
jgi:hypothetical protein